MATRRRREPDVFVPFVGKGGTVRKHRQAGLAVDGRPALTEPRGIWLITRKPLHPHRSK